MTRTMESTVTNRRPLASRSSGWARFLAAALVRAGVAPNAISVISVLFAAAGAWLLCRPLTIGGLLGAALCVQLRLLCNLLDGMVAIEGKRQTATGALYNEIPDRIADSLLIVALGYAAGTASVGWYGALAAAVTAYIRALGGTLGFPQDFRGPMAKPHRMAVLTVACLAAAVELPLAGSRWALIAAGWLIAVGATLTCVTRAHAIAQRLRAK
jgi:phosphatidylglycerophosphate synthase